MGKFLLVKFILLISLPLLAMRAPVDMERFSREDIDLSAFQEVDFIEFPWLGKLVNERGICSGTLVSPHFVLSAAHCSPKKNELTDFEENTVTFSLQENNGFSKVKVLGRVFKIGPRSRLIEYCKIKTGKKQLECLSEFSKSKYDWMLIKLNTPIFLDKYPNINPHFFMSNKFYETQALGYPNQYNSVFALSQTCKTQYLNERSLLSKCTLPIERKEFAYKGTSGGPIIAYVEESNSFEIVGIISSILSDANIKDFYKKIIHEIESDRSMLKK